MPRSLATAALVAAALVPASLAAQPQPAASNVKLIVVPVRADRTAAFERVMDGLMRALAGDAANQAGGLWLRVLKSGPPSPDGLVRYVLLADPAVPQADYSLERLITTRAPADAESLLRDFRFATEGQTSVALDLQQIYAVSPLDALRARLEAGLRDQLAPGALPPPSASASSLNATLDALRQARWTADAFTHEVTDRTTTQWRFAWRGVIRNISPMESLSGTAIVEFQDAQGAPMETVREPLTLVPPQGQAQLSGEFALPADRAARVARIVVRVEPAP